MPIALEGVCHDLGLRLKDVWCVDESKELT